MFKKVERVTEKDISMKEYDDFKVKCQKAIVEINYQLAWQYSIEALTLLDTLAQVRANVGYTVASLSQEAEARYASLISVATGKSADLREAQVKTDKQYNETLEELAKMRAWQLYLDNALKFVEKSHHLFKEGYSSESTQPVS